MVTSVFRPEAELMLFVRTKEIEICIPTEELFPCYRKSGSP